MASSIAFSQLFVREWAGNVTINHRVPEVLDDVPALTLTMTAEAGATIWFTLEPLNDTVRACSACAKFVTTIESLKLPPKSAAGAVRGKSPCRAAELGLDSRI